MFIERASGVKGNGPTSDVIASFLPTRTSLNQPMFASVEI